MNKTTELQNRIQEFYKENPELVIEVESLILSTKAYQDCCTTEEMLDEVNSLTIGILNLVDKQNKLFLAKILMEDV